MLSPYSPQLIADRHRNLGRFEWAWSRVAGAVSAKTRTIFPLLRFTPVRRPPVIAKLLKKLDLGGAADRAVRGRWACQTLAVLCCAELA